MTAMRIKIRDAFADLLRGVEDVNQVFTGRFKPSPDDECPFIRVTAESDSIEAYTDACQSRRALTLTAEIYVESEADTEAAAAEVAEAVEKALASSDAVYLGGLLSEPLIYQSYEFSGNDDADREVAVATMTFEAIYLVEPDVNGAVPLDTVAGTIEGRMPGTAAVIPVQVTGLYGEQDGNDQS